MSLHEAVLHSVVPATHSDPQLCTSIVLVSWPLAINPSKTRVNIFWHTALQTSKSEQIFKVISFLTNCLDLLL